MNEITIKQGVCCMAAGVFVAAVCSLSWRAVHDLPIMLYMARLMTESHAVPYRDFFDMNLPGTYWMFAGLVGVAGCSDLAVRGMDLFVLACVLGVTFLWLRQWGLPVAWLGLSLVAYRYFAGTWAFTLQREHLALLPLSGVLALSFVRPTPVWWHGGAVGLLLAWVFLIKPHLAVLGIPPVALFFASGRTGSGLLRCLTGVAAGFLLPIAAAAMWLVSNGAWGACVEQVTGYWPLYVRMSGSHEVVDVTRRLVLGLRGTGALLFSGYTLCAGIGLFFGYKSGRLSRQSLAAWFGLIFLAALVPGLSGQFWGYHKLPFFYVSLCAAALVFVDAKEDASRRWSAYGTAFGALLALAWFTVAMSRVCAESSGGGAVVAVKRGVPDAFSRYLNEHLRPGDRVQPLDWTGGAVHGMLQAHALPATRFLYTFHFYHHVDSPFIRRIRKEFVDALSARPPRFLLEATDAPVPRGPGTSERFEAFEEWREARYRVVASGAGYRIWELNGA